MFKKMHTLHKGDPSVVLLIDATLGEHMEIFINILQFMQIIMQDPVFLEEKNVTLFSQDIEIMTFNFINSFTTVADSKDD